MASQITCTSVQASYTLPFPKEQLLNVFSHLELPTLHDYMQLGEVCRSWYVLRSNPQFWQIVAKHLNIPLKIDPSANSPFSQIHKCWSFAKSVKDIHPEDGMPSLENCSVFLEGMTGVMEDEKDLPHFYLYIHKPFDDASFNRLAKYFGIDFGKIPIVAADIPKESLETFLSVFRELFKIAPQNQYSDMMESFYSQIESYQEGEHIDSFYYFVGLKFTPDAFRTWCSKKTITIPQAITIQIDPIPNGLTVSQHSVPGAPILQTILGSANQMVVINGSQINASLSAQNPAVLEFYFDDEATITCD